MPVNLKKTEFPPAGVQAGSSSHTFHPEATGVGGKVQSKKLYWLKRTLLHSQRSYPELANLNFVVSKPTHSTTHHTETADAPVFSRPRHLPADKIKAAKAEFNYMLQLVQFMGFPFAYGSKAF